MRLPALALGCLCALAVTLARAQDFEQAKAGHHPSETTFLDRHGEPIQRLRTDRQVRRGAWVPLAEISPALRQALVLSEDKRFYEHSGVDWRAVSSAAWANLWNTRTRGASTLTMQLAGLLDDDLRLAQGGRSLRQKLGQAVMASRLESHWRKDQILEAYLNLVPFRGELVGIDALARTLFAKAPHGLNDAEAAIAAALVRAPNAAPAQVARRACGVLRAMQAARTHADCTALDLQTELALAQRAWPPAEGIAPHFARRLLAALPPDGPAPAQVGTTLDAGLQRLALASLAQHVRELRGRQVEDGAALVLDNASGQVLAWVGSTGALSSAREVDAVSALRQPGSTLKPFLYAQAIAERRLTAASLLHDSPARLQTASGLYIPQNYDLSFKGWVSARTALASSLNVPAVRAIVMVSPRAFHRQLAALGIELPESGDYYGYSLALGSAEASLLQLANAYRALANGGMLCPLRPTSASTPSRPLPLAGEGRGEGCAQAIDPAAAFIATDILADRNARALTFGTDSILATRFWSAVKTGTSKDMRDNWAVGFSSRYTVAVWVGNASGAPMHDVSGTSGAAPVWAELMRHLHARTPSRPPAPPAGLVRASVQFGSGLEAPRSEWFIAGTEQPRFAIEGGPGHKPWASASSAAAGPGTALDPIAARITAPQEGTILALDPDIPPANQRLLLAAEAGSSQARSLAWWVDGRRIGQGEKIRWLPWPGKHRIELRDASGTVHDARRIEVRGAHLRPAAPSQPRNQNSLPN